MWFITVCIATTTGCFQSNCYLSGVACVLRKLSSDFSGVHSIDADCGPSVVHSSRVPLAWDTGGMGQIIYSWSWFFAQFEWCLAICPKFFKVSGNRCTRKGSSMHLELPWLLCWNYGPISLLGGMKNVAVVPLPQTFMFLPQKHGDWFFTVSNEPTDLPVRIIICTIVWTATSSQPLYLASIWQLLRYSGPPQLPVSWILLILCYGHTWRSCLVDQGATMWCLFCWND